MKTFEHFRFSNGVVLRNPLVLAPMTTYSGNKDLTVSDEEIAYYTLRSKTLGMVITAAACVSKNGQAFDNQMGMYDRKFLSGLKALAGAIKKAGSKAVIQLHHGGRMNAPHLYENPEDIVAPSAVKALREGAPKPRALTIEEIHQLIEDFKQATALAIEAGFDGVELHGANTYLLQQFFSPHSNRRTDQYGGSLENRMRFIVELVDGVSEVIAKEAVNPFILGYRFSPEEIEEPGISLEDTLALVERLKDKPLDYLHVSLRRYDQTSSRNKEDKTPIATHLQTVLNHKVPLIGVGDISSYEDIEKAKALGFDLYALGTIALSDPQIGISILSSSASKEFRAETMPSALYERMKKSAQYFESKGYTYKT